MISVVSVLEAAAGIIVAVGTLTGIVWWLVKPRALAWLDRELVTPLHETRHQVKENHHSSSKPTVLDRIDDVHTDVLDAVRELRDDFNNHLLVSSAAQAAGMSEAKAMWDAIKAVAEAKPPEE